VILALLLAIPAVGGALALARPRRMARAATLLTVALVHLALVVLVWLRPLRAGAGDWIALDSLGLLVLSLVSLTFAAVACYAVGYPRSRRPGGDRAFTGCLLMLLAAATLVCSSQHLALLWVGMEAVTLSVAPLIYHEDDRRSLEAVWKYLMLSSLGIALALLGTFFLATAQQTGVPLLFGDLMRGARALHPGWLQGAFVFLLLGYGLKMGLAPLHTWKPDTYGEAPSLVGALMAAGVTACAFLGLARVVAVGHRAGIDPFMQPLLIGFGLLSLGVAATFMLGQRDLKRLLAYSSVEHMGLLVIGLGVGGSGAYGAAYHLLNNGLAKAFAFLTVSNIVLSTGSARLDSGRALLRRVPFSGGLLLAGMLALSASPPFGTFASLLVIVSAIWAGPFAWAALLVCGAMAVAFVPVAAGILESSYGAAPADPGAEPVPENAWLTLVPLALACALIVTGTFLPPPLERALTAAAATLGGTRP
jgi:hydrogenase-4 component F